MGAKTRKLSQINDSLVEWQSVVVADGSTGLTAVAGRGYFINTTGGTITVTLPSSPKTGDIVQLKDYARTWGTNAVSITSTTLDGATNNPSFSTNGQTVTLVYMDNTRGWSLINEDTTTGLGAQFITATGGTVTTSGDFKIHTFTGDGSFVVATVGNPAGGGSKVDYLVVGAGASGGGGPDAAGGGGAGGFRESKDTTLNSPHTASPLAATTGITVTAQTYPITVGAGGAGIPNSPTPDGRGNGGNNSIFSTITSTGGGGGASSGGGVPTSVASGSPGGSGGGSSTTTGSPAGPAGGSGNTPPTSPPQGQNGGTGGTDNSAYRVGGGGGGAGATGGTATNPAPAGGAGGAGVTTSISGSPTSYSGGGGGGGHPNSSRTGGAGGTGGGGAGSFPAAAVSGTANTGGGGGAGGNNSPVSGAGGSGIVLIRYKFQ